MPASRKPASTTSDLPAEPEMPYGKSYELATRRPASRSSRMQMESEKLIEISKLLHFPKSLRPQEQVTQIERALELYDRNAPVKGTPC